MAKKPKTTKKKKTARDKLNPRQQKFCELYATEQEFFGNGVQSYAEAYNVDLKRKKGYNTARTNAHKLLTNTYILAYINKLLEDIALNEAHADKQLAFLMTQNADFSAKISAIKEFNALRQRITKKIEGALNVTLAQAVHKAMNDGSDS